MTSREDVREPSQQDNDIIQTLNNLQHRNAELKAILAYQRQENVINKARYMSLIQRLNSVNGCLEKNAQIFFTLFEDSKNALHMGRSALPSSPRPETVPSPKPGPSGIVTTRKKLNIGRINMKDIERSLENEEEYTIKSSQTHENNIDVIPEESSNASDPRLTLKRLSVKLSRLPCSIVEKHLRKSGQDSSASVSLLDLTTTFTPIKTPELTSTPLKLIEDNRGIKRSPLKSEKLSPVQKKKKPQNKGTPKSSKKKSKKKKTSTTALTLRSPKARRARPVLLKEPSLNTKMRAE